MKNLMGRNLLAGISLLMGCIALLLAGGMLLSGCSSHSEEAYEQVVEEVNAKYGVHFSAELNGNNDLSPDQLRAHLEAIAQSQRL